MWRHQQLFPISRTIGPQADIDLCSVTESRRLQFHLLLTPFNLNSTRTQPLSMVLSIQARADQADSPVLRINLAWDGQWHQGASEMRRHVAVKAAT